MLAIVVACGELKNASDGAPADGGTSETSDARSPNATDDDDDSSRAGTDAGSDADATAPPSVYCDGGCPVEQLSTAAQTKLSAVAVDGDSVYFVDAFGGVRGCPKTGCANATVTISSFDAPANIVVAGDSVHWANGKDLVAAKKAGGESPKTLLTEASDIELFTGSANIRLLWSVSGSPSSIRSCRVPTCSNANAESVIEAAPTALASSGASMAWIDLSGAIFTCTFGIAVGQCGVGKSKIDSFGSTDIAKRDDLVVWRRVSEIYGCNVSACTPKKLAAGSLSPAHLTVDATHFYWSDSIEKAIYRCPVAGCGDKTAERVAAVGENTRFALDAEYIYWTTDEGLFRRRK